MSKPRNRNLRRGGAAVAIAAAAALAVSGCTTTPEEVKPDASGTSQADGTKSSTPSQTPNAPLPIVNPDGTAADPNGAPTDTSGNGSTDNSSNVADGRGGRDSRAGDNGNGGGNSTNVADGNEAPIVIINPDMLNPNGGGSGVVEGGNGSGGGSGSTPGGNGGNVTPGNPGGGDNDGGTTNPGGGDNDGGTTNPGGGDNDGGTTNPGGGDNDGGTTNPGGGTVDPVDPPVDPTDPTDPVDPTDPTDQLAANDATAGAISDFITQFNLLRVGQGLDAVPVENFFVGTGCWSEKPSGQVAGMDSSGNFPDDMHAGYCGSNEVAWAVMGDPSTYEIQGDNAAVAWYVSPGHKSILFPASGTHPAGSKLVFNFAQSNGSTAASAAWVSDADIAAGGFIPAVTIDPTLSTYTPPIGNGSAITPEEEEEIKNSLLPGTPMYVPSTVTSTSGGATAQAVAPGAEATATQEKTASLGGDTAPAVDATGADADAATTGDTAAVDADVTDEAATVDADVAETEATDEAAGVEVTAEVETETYEETADVSYEETETYEETADVSYEETETYESEDTGTSAEFTEPVEVVEPEIELEFEEEDDDAGADFTLEDVAPAAPADQDLAA